MASQILSTSSIGELQAASLRRNCREMMGEVMPIGKKSKRILTIAAALAGAAVLVPYVLFCTRRIAGESSTVRHSANRGSRG